MALSDTQIEESFLTTDEDLKSLLSNILNLNLQNNSSEKLIVNTINKLISVSNTRLQGLEILNATLNNCSKSLITENASTWISHCLVKYAGDSLKEVKLSTIGNIIENVHDEQEFSKKFISDYISKVLETCISIPVNSHETEAALQTLTTCMKYYSSWFNPHKEKIETFIITFLESRSESLVEKAGLAFHYLQQVGGAGADGINHKINFSTNFSKLCATVQRLFDDFFDNEIEIDNSSRSNRDGFNFKDSPHHSQKVPCIMARRITNCIKFLKIMLLKSFPVAKEISPLEVLDMIHRGTAVHDCLSMDNEKSFNDSQFSLLLNKVQIQLLQLLRIFIIWLQEHSLPFSFTISSILMNCLKKIQNCQCFSIESLYQETVYKGLGCWLRVARNAFHAHFQTQLVTCILKDITPKKSNVTLSLQTDAKNKSAKAKRKFIHEKIISSGQSSNSEKITPAEKINREKNCSFALGALKQLLFATTLRIKGNILEELYNTIISSIVDIQTSRIHHPYTNNECQEKLYEVLVAFYEQAALKSLPPLQLTINILNKGACSRNRHIALTCEHGLSNIEKLCQPVCPTLFMPALVEPSKDENKQDMLFDNKILDDTVNQMFNKDTDERASVDNPNDVVENMKPDVIEIDTVRQNSVEIEVKEKEYTEILDEEINVDSEEEIDVEIEDEIQQESAASETLLQQSSVHIIDVQVIKTSTSELEMQQNTQITEEILTEPSKEIEETEIRLQNGNFDSFDTEVKSEEINTGDSASKNDDEPPSKKSRIEEEDGYLSLDIKEETNNLEEVDDTFEEDGAFVDEVKEY